MRCTICGQILSIEEHHQGVHRSWERLQQLETRNQRPTLVDVKELRQLREQAGRPQAWVARHLGVDERSVSRWELGRSTPDVHMQLEWSRLLRSLS